ncbi:hypothetical protein, partial [Enterobacter hormaechei]|uniref:hypothetical protein n=1 Tax=Enterobacter hormaechei TaxID=158836 RepID=UPI002FF38192
VQASPLSRALRGAISFDNLSGAGGNMRKGDCTGLRFCRPGKRSAAGQQPQSIIFPVAYSLRYGRLYPRTG